MRNGTFGGKLYDPFSLAWCFAYETGSGVQEKNLQDSYNTNVSQS